MSDAWGEWLHSQRALLGSFSATLDRTDVVGQETLARLDQAAHILHHSSSSTDLVLGFNDRKNVTFLLDLLLVLDIYPNWCKGFGIPRSSHALDKLLPPSFSFPSNNLLPQATRVLLDLKYTSLDTGFHDLHSLLDSYVAEILTSCLQLAHSSDHEDHDREQWQQQLSLFLKRTGPANYLPPLVALLRRSGTPSWARSHITRILSRTIVGPQGIGHIISFFQSQQDKSLDLFEHMARLIGSVPATTHPREYLVSIGAQLYDALLEEQLDDAACYILSHIYHRHAKISYECVIRPLINPLLPAQQPQSGLEEVRLNERSLLRLLDQLTRLSKQPDRVFFARLVAPIAPSLFYLATFARQAKKSTKYSQSSLALLAAWIRDSSEPETLRLFLDGTLFNGGLTWTFGHSETGGIIIISHPSLDSSSTTPDGRRIVSMDEFDIRCEVFVDLIKRNESESATISDLFIFCLEEWLHPKKNEPSTSLFSKEDPQHVATTYDRQMKQLLAMRMVQELQQYFPTQTFRTNKRLISVVRHVLVAATDQQGSNAADVSAEETNEIREMATVGLNTILAMITSEQEVGGDFAQHASTELAMLLSALSRNSDTALAQASQSVQRALETKTSLGSLISNASMPGKNKSRDTYETATRYLLDESVPRRAQGIHMITELIRKGDPVVATDQIQDTFVMLLGSEEDSFVYLNLIKALSALTERHGTLVTRRLLREYMNDAKNHLDQRLRIGEAINATVRQLGKFLDMRVSELLGSQLVPAAADRGRDVRFRISCLSVLATCFDTNVIGMAQWSSRSIECCLGILQLETTDSEEIYALRNAALQVIGAAGNAIEHLSDFPQHLLRDCTRVCGYVGYTDAHETTRNLARDATALLENISSVPTPAIDSSLDSLRLG